MYQIDQAKKAEIYQDVLNELGNIGAGNAATALSQMVNATIRLSVTTVSLTTIAEVTGHIAPDNDPLTGIYLDIIGDIKGKMLFLLHSDSVDSLVSALMCGMDASMIPQEMKDSALQEVGNIITASYINSISTMTGLTIDESVPTVVTDTFPKIVESAGVGSDKLLFVQSRLQAEQVAVQGNFVFIPDNPSFAVLLKSLQIL